MQAVSSPLPLPPPGGRKDGRKKYLRSSRLRGAIEFLTSIPLGKGCVPVAGVVTAALHWLPFSGGPGATVAAGAAGPGDGLQDAAALTVVGGLPGAGRSSRGGPAAPAGSDAASPTTSRGDAAGGDQGEAAAIVLSGQTFRHITSRGHRGSRLFREALLRDGVLDGRIVFSRNKEFPSAVFSVIKYDPGAESALRRERAAAAAGTGLLLEEAPEEDDSLPAWLRWKGRSYAGLLLPSSERAAAAAAGGAPAQLGAAGSFAPGAGGMAFTAAFTGESNSGGRGALAGAPDAQGAATPVEGGGVGGELGTGAGAAAAAAATGAGGDSSPGAVAAGLLPPGGGASSAGAPAAAAGLLVHRAFDPSGLDDPSIELDKQRFGYRREGYVVSILAFRNERSMKEDMNARFAAKHPWLDRGEGLSLTLSKIRALKRTAVRAWLASKRDLTTVALGVVYFDRLVFGRRVNKGNRKLAMAVCLLLAFKMHEARESEGGDASARAVTGELEAAFGVGRKALLAAEFPVFVHLQFALAAVPAFTVAAHYDRLLRDAGQHPS